MRIKLSEEYSQHGEVMRERFPPCSAIEKGVKFFLTCRSPAYLGPSNQVSMRIFSPPPQKKSTSAEFNKGDWSYSSKNNQKDKLVPTSKYQFNMLLVLVQQMVQKKCGDGDAKKRHFKFETTNLYKRKSNLVNNFFCKNRTKDQI